MHPDLRGRLTLEGKALDLALWTRQTKDRTRIYHSATISEPYVKGQQSGPPLAKGIKVYEFRKRRDSDPDFQSPESFSLLGRNYYLALWVEVGTNDDLEELKFTIALLTEPYSAELTSDCQQTMRALRERLKERVKELEDERAYNESQATAAAAISGDDLDMAAPETAGSPFAKLLKPDPDNLPF
jgi:hypothetical protein